MIAKVVQSKIELHGPEDQDETGDLPHRPRSWPADLLGIDVVGRDRHEWKKHAGDEHAEKSAELGTRSHAEVLPHVDEHPAARADTVQGTP